MTCTSGFYRRVSFFKHRELGEKRGLKLSREHSHYCI